MVLQSYRSAFKGQFILLHWIHRVPRIVRRSNMYLFKRNLHVTVTQNGSTVIGWLAGVTFPPTRCYRDVLIYVYNEYIANVDHSNGQFNPTSNPVDLNGTYTDVLGAAPVAECCWVKTLQKGLQWQWVLINHMRLLYPWQISFKTTLCSCFLFIIPTLKPRTRIDLILCIKAGNSGAFHVFVSHFCMLPICHYKMSALSAESIWSHPSCPSVILHVHGQPTKGEAIKWQVFREKEREV